LVLQRGPVGDPTHSHGACFFSDKVFNAQAAGWGGVIITNHHTGAGFGASPDAFLCGGQGSHVGQITIPAVCIGHQTFHLLFNTTPNFSVNYATEPSISINAAGGTVKVTTTFNGWGYVHLFDAATLNELDTFAIPEAMDETKASGFGTLSNHEVATDPQDAKFAYLSYYGGGLRSLEISNSVSTCSAQGDTAPCLVEVGGYLDPAGNDFWGVEAFVRDGQTIILGSDRDSGLWIFRRTVP
jgi:hypothetical protein